MFSLNTLQRLPKTTSSTSIANTYPRTVVMANCIVLLTFLVTSKVLSPQYFIFVLPLFCLIADKLDRIQWSLWAVIGGLSMFIFPYHYFTDLIWSLTWLGKGSVSLRNSLLVIGVIILARQFFRHGFDSSEQKR